MTDMVSERERLENLLFGKITIPPHLLEGRSTDALVKINYNGFPLYIPRWLYDAAIANKHEDLVPLWLEESSEE